MASVKKIIRSSWLVKRYTSIEGKENRGYNGTPGPKSRPRRASESEAEMDSEGSRHYLRRNASATQSIRDAVGTFRQVNI